MDVYHYSIGVQVVNVFINYRNNYVPTIVLANSLKQNQPSLNIRSQIVQLLLGT